MKKAIVTLSVILLTAVSAFAGGDRTSNRYFYSSFSQNWFIDASGTLNAWNGADRSGLVDFGSLFYKNAAGDFGRFGGSLKVGKFITPAVGLRLGVDMNQATNSYGDFIFENVHADAMLSLMDWLGGYKENRFYRMILVGGFGLAGHANDWFQVKGVNKEFVVNAGIMNNFRLGKSFDFHIDLNAQAPKWQIESNHPTYSGRYTALNFSVGAGLTWYLGGRHFDVCEACPEVKCPEDNSEEKDLQIKNLKSKIAELQAAFNNNSNNNVASNNNVPCDTIVKFVNGETAPFSIFFNKDSYQLRDDRDRINLQEIANVVIENDYIVNLRGTCDDATATSEYNKKLAENRCRKIKDELVKCGVPESKINMDVVGGVKELKPAEYDRRVFISFTK